MPLRSVSPLLLYCTEKRWLGTVTGVCDSSWLTASEKLLGGGLDMTEMLTLSSCGLGVTAI